MCGQAFSQSAGEMFEKALYLEEAQGDLQKAIEIYQQILNQFPKDREISAKSQLHIGLCYEKLGLTEAQKAYQKVLDNFPDQIDTAKVAQEKLSSINKSKAFTEKEDNGFTLKVVWPEPKWAIEGAPSPDGKYLSFVDWDTGDLALRDIKTGKTQRLTDLASHPDKQESAYDSRWSPDSKQLAYCWESDTESYVDLRVIDVASKKPRVLYRGEYDDTWIVPCDWTPDGKYILAGLNHKGYKFILVSVEDRTYHVIKEIEVYERYNFPQGGTLSSDGKYFGYNSQQNAETPNHDVYLLSRDGTNNFPLASHPAHDSFLAWCPEGILITSDRSGTTDLWLVPVEDGKQTRDPVLLRMNIGAITTLGVTQDGSFFFNTAKGNVPYDIYTARIDSNEGGDSISAKKMLLPYEGSNSDPVWSPDGKHLAYISRRGALNMPALYIFCQETGKISNFKINSRAGRARWSPDGRSLLVNSVGQGIYRVDFQSGEHSPLLEHQQEIRVKFPNMSADNKYLYFVRFDSDKTSTLVLSHELATKKENELYSIPLHPHNLVLSPDGEYLALMCSEDPYENKLKKHFLKIIPATGGEVSEVTSFLQKGGWGFVDITWSPDSQFVYFSRLASEQSGERPWDWELWRVPIEGGSAEKLNLVMHRLRSLSMHPDGKQIVFASHSLGVKPAPEVWVMKNYLPENKLP
jgi:Tol biopolymer transport system component